MKTTIEIPEALFRQAKARAAMDGLTLRALSYVGCNWQCKPRQTPRSNAQHFP